MLKNKSILLASLGLLSAAVGFSLVGCGSSGSSTASLSGRAQLTIEWPTRPVTRKIPSAAGALLIEFKNAGGTRVAARWVVKPAPPATQTSVEAFANLPVGPLTLNITAYPGKQDSAATEAVAGAVPTDGTRVGFASVGAQGIASQSVTIKPDNGTGTITLLMEPATKELVIVPDKTVVAPGDAVNFRVEGRLSATDTKVVLLDPANLRWSVSGDAVASGSGSGVGTFAVTVTGFVNPFSVSVTDGESSATKSVQAQASPIAVGGAGAVGIVGAGQPGVNEFVGEGFLNLNAGARSKTDGSFPPNAGNGFYVYPRLGSSAVRPRFEGLDFLLPVTPVVRPFATVIPAIPASGVRIGYVLQAKDATISTYRFTVSPTPSVTPNALPTNYTLDADPYFPRIIGMDRVSPTRVLLLTKNLHDVYRRITFDIVDDGVNADVVEVDNITVKFPTGAGAFTPQAGSDGIAPDIAVDAQERLYVYGTDAKIHRFARDGSLDATFVSTATFTGVNDLEAGADGLVYLSTGDNQRAVLTSLGGVRTPLAPVVSSVPRVEFFANISLVLVPAAVAANYVVFEDRPSLGQAVLHVHTIGARVGELYKAGDTSGPVTDTAGNPLFKNKIDGSVAPFPSANTVPMIHGNYLWDFNVPNP